MVGMCWLVGEDYLIGMLLPPIDASGPRMSAGADIIKTDPHIMRLPA